MIVYTIQKAKYKDIWPCRGALYAEGRWNRPGQWIIYSSESVSLAKLEVLANSITLPKNMSLFEIEIDDSLNIQKLDEDDLPNSWDAFPYPKSLHKLTGQFLKDPNYGVMSVPSVQSKRERNYLIKAEQRDFNKNVRLLNVESEIFDLRLGS